jgi:hypothetical protein
VQSVNVRIKTVRVFHIIVRRVNQIAEIIQWWNILSQYVRDYKICSWLVNGLQMMCHHQKTRTGVVEKDTHT